MRPELDKKSGPLPSREDAKVGSQSTAPAIGYRQAAETLLMLEAVPANIERHAYFEARIEGGSPGQSNVTHASDVRLKAKKAYVCGISDNLGNSHDPLRIWQKHGGNAACNRDLSTSCLVDPSRTS